MEICSVEKIWWGNTDNTWKPKTELSFASFEAAKEFINKEKAYMFSYMHKYNVLVTIENY